MKKNVMKILDRIKSACGSGVPIVAVETSDPQQFIEVISSKDAFKEPPKLIQWDAVRGMVPLNAGGVAIMNQMAAALVEAGAASSLDEAKAMLQQQTLNPTECLSKLVRIGMTKSGGVVFQSAIPEDTLVLMHNALDQVYMNNAPFCQAIWNVRDPFKATGAMLLLMGPQAKLPLQLKNDIIVVSDPYPTVEELRKTAEGVLKSASIKDETLVERCAQASIGCNTFSAEQIISVSLREIGTTKVNVDMEELELNNNRMIEATRGLRVVKNDVRAADVMNVDNFMQFAMKTLRGKRNYKVVILMDEIEKFFAAANTESSGTTQDSLMVILKAMNDNDWSGSVLNGVPGSGKTFGVNAASNEAGVKLIDWDFGAMKGGIVGESEANVRAAVDVVQAIRGSGGVFVFATCNKDAALPPELKRRFGVTFFFDCTTSPEGLARLWSLYIGKYSIPPERAKLDFDFEGWTGAEIKKCCFMAWEQDITLAQASKFIVPVWKQSRQVIESGRKQAQESGYVSAAYDGPYIHPDTIKAAQSGGRRIADKQ